MSGDAFGPGEVPSGTNGYVHAELCINVTHRHTRCDHASHISIWCMYLHSGRSTANDIPLLCMPRTRQDVSGMMKTTTGTEKSQTEKDEASVPQLTVIVGDFNTTTKAARDAVMEKFSFVGCAKDVSWNFPDTTNKRRSLLQCQLDKVCVLYPLEEPFFSKSMMRSPLMTDGYVNKRGQYVEGGLAFSTVPDRGCKDYILINQSTASGENAPSSRTQSVPIHPPPVVLTCGEGFLWNPWNGKEGFLPFRDHWSDHAAVIRDVVLFNSDTDEMVENSKSNSKMSSRDDGVTKKACIRVGTLNLAADQSSPFEWFDEKLEPLYREIAHNLEKSLHDFHGCFEKNAYDELMTLLIQEEQEREEHIVNQNIRERQRGIANRSMLELCIMKCSSSDKNITHRPCLKNCLTPLQKLNESGNVSEIEKYIKKFVSVVCGIMEMPNQIDESDLHRMHHCWWHHQFFALWPMPSYDKATPISVKVSDHVLRLLDFVTMTAFANLFNHSSVPKEKLTKCCERVFEMLSERPCSEEHKAKAIHSPD